ncbi:MAG: hypothetical protein D6813_03845 [Calditrichaeota bacterium]|nr:MAG: hypothetical protein D6813_03845 [Calditrichota bacterium]
MSTLLPEGETVRRAIKWISERRQENPELSLKKLVLEAITRFDLSPKDADFLLEFYKNPPDDG